MCSDRGDLTADGPAHAALDEGDLTQVINDSADGRPLDPADSERLYEQMRKVVRRVRRSRASRRDPATTVLLHEVWIRMHPKKRAAAGDDAGHPAADPPADPPAPRRWPNRQAFFDAVAVCTIQCMVDEYRRRTAKKRGGGIPHLPIDASRDIAANLRRAGDPWSLDPRLLESLSEGLGELRGINPRASTIVVLRFVWGLTNDEIAEMLGMSERTVKRDWRASRQWLFERLGGDPKAAPAPGDAAD